MNHSQTPDKLSSVVLPPKKESTKPLSVQDLIAKAKEALYSIYTVRAQNVSVEELSVSLLYKRTSVALSLELVGPTTQLADASGEAPCERIVKIFEIDTRTGAFISMKNINQ